MARQYVKKLVHYKNDNKLVHYKNETLQVQRFKSRKKKIKMEKLNRDSIEFINETTNKLCFTVLAESNTIIFLLHSFIIEQHNNIPVLNDRSSNFLKLLKRPKT